MTKLAVQFYTQAASGLFLNLRVATHHMSENAYSGETGRDWQNVGGCGVTQHLGFKPSNDYTVLRLEPIQN